MKPFYVRLHAADNVAIIANPEGTSKGTEFACGLTALESIPQANKIALGDLAQGDPLVRYGEVIGHASRAIPKGAWVREDCVTLPSAPDLDQLPLATATPPPLPALDGFAFQGYRNPDGSVGTKNVLGIMSTVQCAAPTLEYAVRRIKTEILPRYRGVTTWSPSPRLTVAEWPSTRRARRFPSARCGTWLSIRISAEK